MRTCTLPKLKLLISSGAIQAQANRQLYVELLHNTNGYSIVKKLDGDVASTFGVRWNLDSSEPRLKLQD